MRRTLFLIHKWLAIPFGVFISIMCFTGAILVFKNEIASLLSCNADEIQFFKAVTKLHRWLFIVPDNPHGGMSIGRFIMGLSAIVATLIMITGAVLWIPRSKKMLKSRLVVSFNKGIHRFVYDSHVSLGIYAFIFVTLMSLTGPVWSFSWYRKGAAAVLGVKDGRPDKTARPTAAEPFGKEQKEGFKHGNEEGFKHGNGDSRSGKDLSREGNSSVNHGEKFHSVNQKDMSREGKDVSPNVNKDNAGDSKAAVNKKKGSSAQKTFISLHTGKWGGMLVRIIYFIAAIIGGFLPISGYYLWLKKRSHRSK